MFLNWLRTALVACHRPRHLNSNVGRLYLMKQCHTCNRTYPDNALNFCLDDGTPLAAFYDAEATLVINPEPQTGPVAQKLTKEQNAYSHLRPSLGKWVFFLSIGLVFASIPISSHNRQLPIGLAPTVILLSLCSYYFWFLTRGKQSLLTCLRKAYINLFTFLAAVMWLVWWLGYMNQMNFDLK